MSGLSSAECTPIKKKPKQCKKEEWHTDVLEEKKDEILIKRGSRVYLNQNEVDKLKAERVNKVPDTPNGNLRYEVSYNENKPLIGIYDTWNWSRSQHCPRREFCKGGRRTLQMCGGSFECRNVKCAFRNINQHSNKADFNRSKHCKHCNQEATKIKCSARKYVENDRCHNKLTVIYIGFHSCFPKAAEEKPNEEEVKDILKQRPTITTGQIQLEKIRQVLLDGKSDSNSLEDAAMKFSDTRHLHYLKSKVNEKSRPDGSDIEAIRLLKEDFCKRGLDENLIMEVGENSVFLSSEQKIRMAALITLGKINEPVSLDGCESLTKDYTEIELTTYNPVLRRNVKLVSSFVPKPGENSENVARLVRYFDKAVNKIIPSVALEYNLKANDFLGKGLDAHAYVGDEGGALWSGLCKAKGNDIKTKTVSDYFNFKQDINRHNVYFSSEKDKSKFQQFMVDAYNAVTNVHAEEAETALLKLISTKSNNPTKMMNFKNWWWRRKARWQKWCRIQSSSLASSAEVSNAKSVSASGYRKRLLDVVIMECSAAILETAEIKRQALGRKTIGKGPTSAERREKSDQELFVDIDRCASAAQDIERRQSEIQGVGSIEMAQNDYRVNVKDSHRSDRNRKVPQARRVEKKNLGFFMKKVNNVQMDLMASNSNINEFNFMIFDTMGYLEKIKMTKYIATCTSIGCKSGCHHLVWVFHNIFNFGKHDHLIYKTKFTQAEWKEITNKYPEKLPITQIPKAVNQNYYINVRTGSKEAKCAICKRILQSGDLQASTTGPYRTIQRRWISRTFYFCPCIACMSKLPRNSYISTYNSPTMPLYFDENLTESQKQSIN
ncbi:uncharacterized protein [Antedon mediterranea]|uniref:uncharacterized protein n=1 Tax=Antedon mediterranea TaxID=105859 RepID=UPI003AF63C45